MNILIKGFFRSKFIKTYLVMFTTLIVIITILFTFGTYYSNIKTKTYQENTYFLIRSDRDIFKEVSEQKEVESLERILLFKPEENMNLIIENNIKWFNLLDSNNEFIVVLSENGSVELNNNEITLQIRNDTLKNFDFLYDLRGKSINAYYLNNSYTFQIKDIINSNFFRVIISKKKFEELLNNTNSYNYIYHINNYDKIDSIINEVNEIDGIKEIKFIESYNSEETFNALKELENVIVVLNYASYIFFFIFFFLTLVIIKNVVNDEFKKMNLERLLGYSNIQIKKILIIKLIFLNIVTILLSNLVYIVICSFIKKYTKIGFNVFNNSILLIIFIILSIFSILFGLLARTNKK